MGVYGGAYAALGVEVCAPLLLLCWLCCWPDSSHSDSSSTGDHPKKPVLTGEHRRKSSDLFGRRIGSSVASLHLPSTSGSSKQPLCAHRSHEEIPQRARGLRPPSVEGAAAAGRYHSAPSVIEEVLHRRDWERSSTALHIPLRPDSKDPIDSDESSPEAPHAEPESSSIETRSYERLNCKKHYTNIKSSKNKKEATRDDIKDTDATETQFYIGEEANLDINNDAAVVYHKVNPGVGPKEAKQSFNESIRTKELSDEERDGYNLVLDRYLLKAFDFNLDMSEVEEDRSGAMHHDGSRASLLTCLSGVQVHPPSVEAVGWEGGACYLSERGRRVSGAGGAGGAGARGRHASDGDILANNHRPESGAFSESDLDLELEGVDERPPPYDHLDDPQAGHRPRQSGAKETAI